MVNEDLDDFAEELAQKTGRGWENLEKNPLYGKVITVKRIGSVLEFSAKSNFPNRSLTHAAFLNAEKKFNRVSGYKELWLLENALKALSSDNQQTAELAKNARVA